MGAHWWIQQVTTRVGAVTCWIQQPVSPMQVGGLTCVFNFEVDQLIRKLVVRKIEDFFKTLFRENQKETKKIFQKFE